MKLCDYMSLIIRIVFLIVGTILTALGFIGLYGVIKLSEGSSDSFFLASQAIIPVGLIIIGIFLLAQFYKKPKNQDKVK